VSKEILVRIEPTFCYTYLLGKSDLRVYQLRYNLPTEKRLLNLLININETQLHTNELCVKWVCLMKFSVGGLPQSETAASWPSLVSRPRPRPRRSTSTTLSHPRVEGVLHAKFWVGRTNGAGVIMAQTHTHTHIQTDWQIYKKTHLVRFSNTVGTFLFF
jgi:hypothetical protein